MDYEEKIEYITDENPDALVLDGFEDSLIGATLGGPEAVRAVYDAKKVILQLIEQGMGELEAAQFLQEELLGTYSGENEPVFTMVFAEAPVIQVGDLCMCKHRQLGVVEKISRSKKGAVVYKGQNIQTKDKWQSKEPKLILTAAMLEEILPILNGGATE